jgi:hypothetical protein
VSNSLGTNGVSAPSKAHPQGRGHGKGVTNNRRETGQERGNKPPQAASEAVQKPDGAFAKLKSVIARAYAGLVNKMKSASVFEESATATGPLNVGKRILAGGLGAICFHSAIVLYKISYTLHPEGELKSMTIDGARSALSIVMYWTIINCIVFSGYSRRADFAHIFRASFLFSIFIYTVGAVAAGLPSAFPKFAAL